MLEDHGPAFEAASRLVVHHSVLARRTREILADGWVHAVPAFKTPTPQRLVHIAVPSALIVYRASRHAEKPVNRLVVRVPRCRLQVVVDRSMHGPLASDDDDLPSAGL